MSRFRLAIALAVAGGLLLDGCVSVRTSHGYLLERGETKLTAEPGFDTKDSVLARYGEPSMIGTFDPDSWYYMTSADAARAFFKPKATYRAIVAFHFDDEGVVKEVENLDLSDGMDVKIASRTTPTRGKELSFWEQLLGNVGKLPASSQGIDPETGRQGPQ
ncbi:MAG: outer membrane protein assembly factor BamE [Pseudomonadota bacterium]|nr:outer membrane protein assembly factor BamE [Pseudomonadota bacterium]